MDGLQFRRRVLIIVVALVVCGRPRRSRVAGPAKDDDIIRAINVLCCVLLHQLGKG